MVLISVLAKLKLIRLNLHSLGKMETGDKPTSSQTSVFGRNKEITDEFSLRRQANKAVSESRKSSGGTVANPGRPRPGNFKTQKVVTKPPLSV